jgi:hypothetical protein
LFTAAAAVLLLGGLFGSAPSVHAQVTVPNGCMEEVAGRNLNCTANDVQIAGVATDANGEPLLTILDDGCAFLGDEVTFEATFEVVLTAQERHDIGIYFATDGDLNGDGAVSGACSISSVARTPDPPWLDLDGTGDDFAGTNIASNIQDTCGDIDALHNPLFPVITITTECIDPDGNGTLNLPNCTSWRQPGANELCTGPVPEMDIGGPGLSSSGVTPGAPSKCRCDAGFEVPIDVPQAELLVTKTATPTSVSEPGGVVTFDVTVQNTGIDPNNSVTLDSLSDDIYGDITLVQGDLLSTTCSVPQIIAGDGGSYSCSFTANVNGNAGDSHTDTVTASGLDDNANVDVDAVPLSIVKSTTTPTLAEPGGTFSFSVVITNNSTADTATLSDVDDAWAGDAPLTDSGTQDLQGSCGVAFPHDLHDLAPGGSLTCSFTTDHTGNSGDSWTDAVTVAATDDDGADVGGTSNEVTVSLTDVPSSILTTKTASPTSVDEPGGDVTFTITVQNTSAVDDVTINSVIDNQFGDISGFCTPQLPATLAPSQSVTCTITEFVSGDVGQTFTNVATGSGEDDDGNPVSDDDSADVTFNDVPPAASLTKTASMVVATFDVVVTRCRRPSRWVGATAAHSTARSIRRRTRIR